jgi:hypothetical protein
MKCPHCGRFIEVNTRAGAPETSKAAGRKMEAHSKNLRGKILVAMWRADRPMTDEEIDAATRKPGGPDSSIRARRSELVDMDLVEYTGKDVPNSHRNMAQQWRLTDRGIEIANWIDAEGKE